MSLKIIWNYVLFRIKNWKTHNWWAPRVLPTLPLSIYCCVSPCLHQDIFSAPSEHPGWIPRWMEDSATESVFEEAQVQLNSKKRNYRAVPLQAVRWMTISVGLVSETVNTRGLSWRWHWILGERMRGKCPARTIVGRTKKIVSDFRLLFDLMDNGVENKWLEFTLVVCFWFGVVWLSEKVGTWQNCKLFLK